jgi:hypothetical protein
MTKRWHSIRTTSQRSGDRRCRYGASVELTRGSRGRCTRSRSPSAALQRWAFSRAACSGGTARRSASGLRRDGSEAVGTYVAPLAMLIAEIGLGDEDRTADLLRQTREIETGPISFATTIKPELDALLVHPRLGPLVRRLSLYAQHPQRRRRCSRSIRSLSRVRDPYLTTEREAALSLAPNAMHTQISCVRRAILCDDGDFEH